jgi:hypothetical protein
MRLIPPIPNARISQRFGEHPAWYAPYGLAGHEGLDLAVPTGTPVFAAHDGTATVRLGSPTYGDYVTVQSEQVDTLYAHLSRVHVEQGDAVRAGDIIGLSGNTGRSFGDHLHFGVRPNPIDLLNGFKGWVDPERFLGGEEEEGYMLSTLHFQRVPDWANGVLRDWRSGWVKVVNPAPMLAFPDVPRLLVRFHTDARDAEYLRDGREGGKRFVADMADQWLSIPGASAFELANEPDCNTGQGLANLREYTIGAIEEAERRGIKLCILNLSEGNPHDDGVSQAGGSDAEARAVERWKWEQLAEAVKLAARGGHYLGLHAYWRPGVEGPSGRYHALGRRRWDIETLLSMGVPASLKVLVNECGIDGGIAGGPPEKGWRDLSNADAYRAEIAEAEAFARMVPQIQMVAYFTAGYEKPWGGYDIDEPFARSCTDGLRAVADAGGYVAPQPIAPEPPATPPTLDAAFLAEARTHKVPQNPDAALYKAIRAAGQEIQGDEWAARDTVWQWGYDKAALVWHLWAWTPQRGAWCEYSEEVTR